MSAAADPAQATSDDPGGAWARAMRRGDLAAAWAINDRVLAERLRTSLSCDDWPRHLQFVWRGKPLDGRRVLVRCYHGLGDTIQFARFAHHLRQLECHVNFWAQPQLVRLLQLVDGIDEVIPLHDGTPDAAYEVDIEVMELPHALRIGLEALARTVPYIRVPTGDRARADREHSNSRRLQVGIAWDAGHWDEKRSLPIGALRALREAPVDWFSLQYLAPEEGLGALGGSNLARRDLVDQARTMAPLDLVISVDTMIAHLAGAMGLPTWLLLRHECDWRWMESRRDSPWYPTLRLYRQDLDGEWPSVLREVKRDLRQAAHDAANRRNTSQSDDSGRY